VRIRTVKTASGSIAVQVVDYRGKRALIRKHIGSAKTKTDLSLLKELAREWIIESFGQQSLLPEETEDNVLLRKYRYLGYRYGLIEEVIRRIFNTTGLDQLEMRTNKMFLDLVLIRIVEPASKRESRKLLSDLFGIKYDLTAIYRSLSEFSLLKDAVEKQLISFARKHLSFDFSFVLYDITTLYFETFTEDELRKAGFSKDNKVGQPQILVGLIVNQEGFPLSFTIFEGNTFEGNTLIPVILDFKKKHKVQTLTVVADAAMISHKNITALKKAGLSYIVGARLGNMSRQIIALIDKKLPRTDGACLRLETVDGFLIVHFSDPRYDKDKHEMEKQLERVVNIQAGEQEVKRNKFLLRSTKTAYTFNTAVIEKTRALLGIKGYHTDLILPEKIIVDRYSDLWQVEKAFKISKNDLLARPVYHFHKQTIIAHLLICIVSLAICKYLEIQTGKSARFIIDKLKSVTDARMLNTITGKETLIRGEISAEVQTLLSQINPPH
jgi:transposase